MDYSGFNAPFNNSTGQNKISYPYMAVIVLIVIAFLSIWMSWLTIKVDVFGYSKKENIDFTEIMENSEGYTEYNDWLGSNEEEKSKLLSKSEFDSMINAYHTMKYAGVIGFVLLGVALVCVFVNRKLMVLFLALASLAFAVAIIGDITYCSKTKSFIDKLLKEYLGGSSLTIDFSIKIGIGIITALAATVAAAVIGFRTVNNEKAPDYY